MLGGPQTHLMLYGGSRSGKTFLLVRSLILRALHAPGSRHAVLRFRFNAVKQAICYDTFPRVLELCWPEIEAPISKSDWYAKLPNGSEIWFGGLDDKERTEKILGQEYATIYLNEASQIPWSSRNIAVTRLAQRVMKTTDSRPLQPRMYYDCNPPSKAHWTYKVFHDRIDPETREPLPNPADFAYFQINPDSNVANLSDGYLDTLKAMGARLRKRFLAGEFADATPGALFSDEMIDRWRCTPDKVPDMVRVIVGIDPSGSGDIDNADNDAIGIVIAGLGTDGNAYVLEDATVKAGPATWGRLAISAYERHDADAIVGEVNFGGAMVEQTIQVAAKAAGTRATFRPVTASRGKVVRAEPFSLLYEEGKVRHAGDFLSLEDELTAFSTAGYTGSGSPNRADALIWALSELFPGIMRKRVIDEPAIDRYRKKAQPRASAWAAI